MARKKKGDDFIPLHQCRDLAHVPGACELLHHMLVEHSPGDQPIRVFQGSGRDRRGRELSDVFVVRTPAAKAAMLALAIELEGKVRADVKELKRLYKLEGPAASSPK